MNTSRWTDLCALTDLPPNAGLAARVDESQIALFHLPDSDEKVFPMVPAGAPIEDVFDQDDLNKEA